MKGFGFQRIALVGDSFGLGMLLDAVPRERVACIVGASIRPACLASLEELSRRHHLPLLVQVRRMDPDFKKFLEGMKRLDCDSLICNSYSMLLPGEILSLVGGQAYNFHCSLLPRNRGPNPVQWSIIRGEAETGVTFHRMDGDFDSGPILRQQAVPINFEDTWVDVTQRINALLPPFVNQGVALLLDGNLTPRLQDDRLATRNPRLTSESPRIHFDQMSDLQIYNLVRAQVAPLAGAFVVRNELEVRFPGRLTLSEIAALRQGDFSVQGR